jgi:hypothetical protein
VLGDASSFLVDADPLLGPMLKNVGAFSGIKEKWLLVGLLFMIQGVTSLLTTFGLLLCYDG